MLVLAAANILIPSSSFTGTTVRRFGTGTPRELAETSRSLGKNTSLNCLDSTAFSSTSSLYAPVTIGIWDPSAGMVAQGSSGIMFLMAWRLLGFPDHLETVWMRSAYF